jgi:2-C-methyl-D-erythritol 4-phosphate cytidylyltransferase
MASNVAAIICAAGASERFGGKRRKPFVDVAGRAAFVRSVEVFADRSDVKQILVAIPADEEEMAEVKWGAKLAFYNAKLYVGGSERFETVAKGLKLLKDDIDIVAVHDAVRCCVTKEWVDEVIKAAEKSGAAMLACPVTATLKKVEDGAIVETVDRSGLYEAQTPQVFKRAMLEKAYGNLDKLDKSKISDDAQLVEALGEKVSIVETDRSNVKITQMSDLTIAEAIIKMRSKAEQKGPIGPYIEAQW